MKHKFMTELLEKSPEIMVSCWIIERLPHSSSDLGNRRRRHQALAKELDNIMKPAEDKRDAIKIEPRQEGLFEKVDDTEDDE